MAESLYADATLANNSCASPANAHGEPDGTYTTNDDHTNWDCRWSMDNPSGALDTATQTVTVTLRKSASGGNGDPTATVDLYLNGTLVTNLVASTSITDATTQLQGTFDTTDLGTTDGTNVEILLNVVGQGGQPAGRRNVQVDGITWTAEIAATPAPSGSGTVDGDGALSATGSTSRSGSGTTTGQGVPSATGSTTRAGSGTTTAEASTSATGATSRSGSGTTTAQGSLSATGSAPAVGGASGSGSVEGEGSTTAAGAASHAGSGTTTAQGSLSATGSAPSLAVPSGSGTTTGHGALSAAGFCTYRGSGTTSGVGSLVAAGPSSAPSTPKNIIPVVRIPRPAPSSVYRRVSGAPPPPRV